ncbi:hypothetical protein DFJ73DRAFT_794565 [Zopfochytrium polystomum]|nr:hypothetical protein DFJ73DRAFT_794565 [Zopfochytrium polystomum]
MSATSLTAAAVPTKPPSPAPLASAALEYLGYNPATALLPSALVRSGIAPFVRRTAIPDADSDLELNAAAATATAHAARTHVAAMMALRGLAAVALLATWAVQTAVRVRVAAADDGPAAVWTAAVTVFPAAPSPPPTDDGIPTLAGAAPVSDAYAMTVVFYFALLILHGHLHLTEPAPLGPRIHLTMWSLHAFTMTIVTASTLSYALQRLATDNGEAAGTGPFAPEVAVGAAAVALEMLLSSWTVQWPLLAWGLAWSVVVGVVLGVARNLLSALGIPVLAGVTRVLPTPAGLLLILISFGVVWLVETFRDGVDCVFFCDDAEMEDARVVVDDIEIGWCRDAQLEKALTYGLAASSKEERVALLDA